jgi:hypothetical protein
LGQSLHFVVLHLGSCKLGVLQVLLLLLLVLLLTG